MSSKSSGGLHPYWLIPIALLMCLGCPVYVGWTTITDRADKAGMTDAATSYLDAWRDGQPVRAEEWICGSERKKAVSQRRLPFPGDLKLTGYRIIEAEVHRDSETPTLYSVDVELALADGRQRTARYWMSDEHAGWRVCVESVTD